MCCLLLIIILFIPNISSEITTGTDEGISVQSDETRRELVCKNPSMFCRLNGCHLLKSDQCGCLNVNGVHCEQVTNYKVQVSECSFDGLSVRSDFEVGFIPNRVADNVLLLGEICNENGSPAQSFINSNEDGEMAIQIKTTSCWNVSAFTEINMKQEKFIEFLLPEIEPAGGVLTFGHIVTIKDPDGYLMEKMLLRILENVDIGTAMNEFELKVQTDEDTGKKEGEQFQKVDVLKLESILRNKILSSESQSKGQGKGLKWGCTPEPVSVFMNPHLRAYMWHFNNDNSSEAYGATKGLETKWSSGSEGGLVVNSHVANYPTTQCSEDDGGASVILETSLHQDWRLNISISRCFQTPSDNLTTNEKQVVVPSPSFENMPSGLLQFTANLQINESNFYKEIVKIAKERFLQQQSK